MKYLILFFPFYLMADSWYDGRMYFTDKLSLTLSWDAVENATFYEVKEIWYDTGAEYSLGSTQNISFQINKRRAGHFRYNVRSCRYDVDNNKLCSEWADSLNIETAQLHDNGPGRWLVYWRLSPPSGPVIE